MSAFSQDLEAPLGLTYPLTEIQNNGGVLSELTLADGTVLELSVRGGCAADL